MSSTNRFPERMTAIEIARPGGPEVLVATSRPLPTPGPREVLVEVRAAGVNGPDVLQRKGVYDRRPAPRTFPAWRSPARCGRSAARSAASPSARR